MKVGQPLYISEEFLERVCALGASYGGYMINWMLGQTNTFACLVVHDGMFDTFRYVEYITETK